MLITDLPQRRQHFPPFHFFISEGVAQKELLDKSFHYYQFLLITGLFNSLSYVYSPTNVYRGDKATLFSLQRLFTRFVTRVMRWVPLMEQELLTLPEHLSSILFSNQCLVDCCLSFSFGHYVVCPSIYGFHYPFSIFKRFLIFSSPEPKVQDSFSHHLSFSVCHLNLHMLIFFSRTTTESNVDYDCLEDQAYPVCRQ